MNKNEFKKKLKELSTNKRLIILFCFLLIVLVAYTIFWSVFCYKNYWRFEDTTAKNLLDYFPENAYTYVAFEPHLFFYDGNLYVESPQGNDVIIWLKPFREPKYGFTVITEEGESVGFLFTDGDMNPINGTEQEEIDEFYDIIKDLFDRANSYYELK